MQQIQDGRRKLRHQLPMVFGVAGARDLEDSRCEILPDARYLAQSRPVEPCELVRVIGDDVGAVSIRANLEWIVVLDLEKVGDLPENSRDGGIIQAAVLRPRCGTRARARL